MADVKIFLHPLKMPAGEEKGQYSTEAWVKSIEEELRRMIISVPASKCVIFPVQLDDGCGHKVSTIGIIADCRIHELYAG